MPCPGAFHFSHMLPIMRMTSVSLILMLVLLSWYVMFSILLHFLLCDCTFVVRLVSVQVSTILQGYIIGGSTFVVRLVSVQVSTILQGYIIGGSSASSRIRFLPVQAQPTAARSSRRTVFTLGDIFT